MQVKSSEGAHHMQPAQITYHGVEPSEALTELIHERAAHLERVGGRILAMRVLVDAPHHHQRHGNHYRVTIEMTVPGGDVVVGHDVGEHTGDEDAYAAVRRAFDAARRCLSAAQSRRHGKERAQVDRLPTIRRAR
jgi:ribosome-associated translation inhibitor RaiA